MQAKSTNIEGLLAKLKTLATTDNKVRLGPKITQFIRSAVTNEQELGWITDNYGTQKYLTDSDWKIVPRFARPDLAFKRKVMITGKLLQIEHLKSHFAMVCSTEPDSLRSIVMGRIEKLPKTLDFNEWKNPQEVKSFLLRFIEGLKTSKETDKQFTTKFVDIPSHLSHIGCVRLLNASLTQEWLLRKGFQLRQRNIQKVIPNDTDQKENTADDFVGG